MSARPSSQAPREKYGVDIFGHPPIAETATRAAERWLILRSENVEDYVARLLRSTKAQLSLPDHRLDSSAIQVAAAHLVEFVRKGVPVKQAAKIISGAAPVAPRLAELVASDGIRFVNAAVTRFQQEELGVKTYTWRAIDDGRENPEHIKREGSVYQWGAAAPPGGHPGEDVGCRCMAEPVLPSWDEAEHGELEQRQPKKSGALAGMLSGC